MNAALTLTTARAISDKCADAARHDRWGNSLPEVRELSPVEGLLAWAEVTGEILTAKEPT